MSLQSPLFSQSNIPSAALEIGTSIFLTRQLDITPLPEKLSSFRCSNMPSVWACYSCYRKHPPLGVREEGEVCPVLPPKRSNKLRCSKMYVIPSNHLASK